MRIISVGRSLAFAALAWTLAAIPAFAAPKKAAPPQDPPLTAHIVRSSMPGCEPDCPQWIAVSGALTAGSPAVFKKALKQAGKARLPVIINSPGGDVDAALAIGRMIRERKLDVAVGWTLYSGCAPKDKACKLPKADKGVYRGLIFAFNGYCLSACPFILAAGQKRLAGGGALVGVHQISSQSIQERVTYREEYRMVNGKKKVISRKVLGRKTVKGKVTAKMSKPLRRKLEAYLQGMGVKPALVDLLDRAPPESIYLLQHDDLNSTDLATSQESAVTMGDPGLCKFDQPAENCR